MKNLKRILALVLCLAMVMGLAVSAGATSFTDDADISEDNATAVEVLTALGIINGYEDGSFQPTATVTRAEVAKMIAVAFNGGDESINDLYANVVCGLTDIGGSWAEGYIKYCYATGIIDGYPDGTFLPDGEITGLELCQIMLNILNYEVTWDSDTPWATAIMAKSSSIGLLKNVSTAVGSAITRQEAAQVIFNALTLPIQGYNALGVRIDSDDTILSLYLGGEVDTIVITANEYASLTDDEPTDAGVIETEDGDTYDWDTDAIEQSFDTIGMAYTVWIVGDSVVYAADAGNEYDEFDSTVKKLSKVTDYDLDDAEYFINFDDEAEDVYTAEYRIKYVIETEADSDAAAKVDALFDTYGDGDTYNGTSYTNTIVAEDELTELDYQLIKYIFKYADRDVNGFEVGEVYVGTKTGVDYSDSNSFADFLDEVVTVTEETVSSVTNTNGDYVKVIDNDGDGDAEYVLKTEYIMAVVDDIASSGKYTLYATDDGDEITAGGSGDYDLYLFDEVDEGDVVVVTLIDGVAYIYLAEVVTVNIDDIDYDDEILTTDEEVEYEQSYIEVDEDVEGEFVESFDADVIFEITDADEGYDYDLYLDKYGYVRVLTLSDSTSGYGLLTDAYYYTNGRGSGRVYEVEMYAETDEAEDYTVNWSASTCDVDYYVDTDGYDDNGTWGRLFEFGAVDDDDEEINDNQSAEGTFVTNVALYSGNTDSVIISEPALSSTKDVIEAEIEGGIAKLSTKKLETIDGDTVYVTSDTLYYYVELNSNGTDVTDVIVYTGYSGYSDVDLDNVQDTENVAYTIAYKSGDAYYASVVVIETKVVTNNVAFVTEITTKTSRSRYVLTGIGVDDDEAYDGVVATGLTSADDENENVFYNIMGKSATEIEAGQYAEYGIYAATVRTVKGDYVYLSTGIDYDEDEVAVYYITDNSDIISTTASTGDDLIYFTDGDYDDDVIYAIDVTKSYTKGDKDLSGLYDDVAADTADVLDDDDDDDEDDTSNWTNVTEDYDVTVAGTYEVEVVALYTNDDGDFRIEMESGTVYLLTATETEGTYTFTSINGNEYTVTITAEAEEDA